MAGGLELLECGLKAFETALFKTKLSLLSLRLLSLRALGLSSFCGKGDTGETEDVLPQPLWLDTCLLLPRGLSGDDGCGCG